MPHYEATVRVLDIVEPDTSAARRIVEEQLRAAGFSRCQVVHVGIQGAARRPRRVAERVGENTAGGNLFVAAVVAWGLWFLWLLAG